MRRICVLAGSRLGSRPEYERAAHTLGRELARRGLGLVYAGGDAGLMAVVAKAATTPGGEVIGVVARSGQACGGQRGPMTRLYEVGSAQERTALMVELADATVALPGGWGTFDELFTLTDWPQLGPHPKPVGLLDVEGFYAPLLWQISLASHEGFIATGRVPPLFAASSAPELLDSLTSNFADALTVCEEVTR